MIDQYFDEQVMIIEHRLRDWALNYLGTQVDFRYEQTLCCYTPGYFVRPTIAFTDSIDFWTVYWPHLGGFQQFLYEYGLTDLNIDISILALLHEVGHAMTIESFSEDEWCEYQNYIGMLSFLYGDEHSFERESKYWTTEIELAANLWAISFIQNCPGAVQQLREIMEGF